MVGSEWLTSIPIHRTLVAQLVEQRPFKADVVGSNPTESTKKKTKKSKKNVDTIRKKAVRSDVWEMIKKGVL